jgi:hypothetical protein
MDFQIYHEYNKLARRGLVKPLACQGCDEELVLMQQDGEPVFKCYICDDVITPGIGTYDQVRFVVEHFRRQNG